MTVRFFFTLGHFSKRKQPPKKRLFRTPRTCHAYRRAAPGSPSTRMRGMTVRFFFTLGHFSKRKQPPKKTSKLLYYFLSLCKTFNELFHLPPPLRSGHTRPCFPKASAKVQPFTITAKRFLYYFLSLCKTFNELFHLPPPLRSGHTRPCFPKASAKVQPFTITAKRLPIKTEKNINRINLHLIIFNVFRCLNRVFPPHTHI